MMTLHIDLYGVQIAQKALRINWEDALSPVLILYLTKFCCYIEVIDRFGGQYVVIPAQDSVSRSIATHK